MASGSARSTSASRPSAAAQRKASAAFAEGSVQQQQQQQPRTEFSQGAHLIAAAAPQDAGEALGRWEAAVGNLEDARVALDVVAKAIDDAVYLDEDAFRQVAPVAQYARQLQAHVQRVAALEAELEEASAALARQQAAARIAERRAADLTQELENNAVVFRMHYTELLSKDEEIAKLQAVIQALSGK